MAAPARQEVIVISDDDDEHNNDHGVSSVDDCLQRVLAIFPDVDHEHVRNLFLELDIDTGLDAMPAVSPFEDIVERLLSSDKYPKQDKDKQPGLKRKRQDSADIEENDAQRWEGPNRLNTPNGLVGVMSEMLKAEFPEFSRKEIGRLLAGGKHYYQTHLKLAEAKASNHPSFGRGRPIHSSRTKGSAETLAATQRQHPLLEELYAARKRVDELKVERATQQAEQENLQRAIDAGETAECTACMDELPMNRQICCDGDEAHFTCFACAQTYIGTLVGDAKCDMRCPSGCGAGFTPSQLAQLSDQGLVVKLGQLQQQKDIRDAAMDDIGECPFCDFKGIVPPIEVDFEFRCGNPECEQVSCRRCNSLSHIPQSCQEYALENKLSSRHTVEEAMTAALVRKCNSCKKPFIKEAGCNKMTCPSCGHMQCYICSVSVPSYDHFVNGPRDSRGGWKGRTGCLLYDDVDERHEREVKEAETTARARVITANPDVSEEDLEIKIPDSVKPTLNVGAARLNGFLGPHHLYHGRVFHMRGLDQHVRQPAPVNHVQAAAPFQYVRAVAPFHQVQAAVPFHQVQAAAPIHHLQATAPFQHVQAAPAFQQMNRHQNQQYMQPFDPLQQPDDQQHHNHFHDLFRARNTDL